MQESKPKLWLPLIAAAGLGLSILALNLEPPPSPASADAPEEQPTAPAEASKSTAQPTPAAKLEDAQTFTIRNDRVEAEVVSSGGGLAHYRLLGDRFQRDGQAIDLVTTWKPKYLPLTLTAEGIDLRPDAPWQGEQLSESAVRLKWQAAGVELTRKVELAKGPYQVWSTLTVRNGSDKPIKVQPGVRGVHWVTREQESGNSFIVPTRSYFLASGICGADGETEKDDREDIVEEGQMAEGAVSFGSVENMYFTQAIASDGEPFVRCTLTGQDLPNTDSAQGSLLISRLDHKPAEIAPGESQTFRSLAFIGPKIPDLLQGAGHGLGDAIDVGGVAGINTIAKGLASLLQAIESVVGNWGLAIILLTFCVKLVLYPLTAKSFESMAAMRRLKPEIDALNDKYGDDRQAKGEAMMALYKEHKINPVGGCLPAVLQMPIWFALYMSLSSNVELFRQPFILYWDDLSAPDPFYLLPLGLGALMFVQQKLTPTTMDPMQAKMMLYMMPSMITVFMLFLPSGLTLYMFTNSALTIVQQKYNERKYLADTGAEQSKEPEPAVDAAGSSNSNSPKAKPKTRRTRRGRA